MSSSVAEAAAAAVAARQSPADRPRNNPLRGREGVFAGGKEPRAAEGRIYTETIAKINKAARVGGLPCYTRRETVGVPVYSRLARSTDRLTRALRIRRVSNSVNSSQKSGKYWKCPGI